MRCTVIYFRTRHSSTESSSSDHSERQHKRVHSSFECKGKKDTSKHKKHHTKKSKSKQGDGSSDDYAVKLPELSEQNSYSNAAAQLKKPMTKEEWERQQSEVKRVFDPDTGRMRLAFSIILT
jgi:hypothetical protein